MADYTKYPNQIDTSTELPKATDLITPINSEFVNRLREAILAIENELGAQPSGTNSTVRARLDYLDSRIGTTDGGTGESVSLIPCTYVYNLLSEIGVSSNAGYQTLGGTLLNPSAFFSGNSEVTRNITFDAVIYGTSGVTAEIVLYNVTDAVVVSDTLLNSSGSTSPIKVSANLQVGDNIDNSEKHYEIQMRISEPEFPSIGNFAFCSYAAINISYI
jgi:hypothetical protein